MKLLFAQIIDIMSRYYIKKLIKKTHNNLKQIHVTPGLGKKSFPGFKSCNIKF